VRLFTHVSHLCRLQKKLCNVVTYQSSLLRLHNSIGMRITPYMFSHLLKGFLHNRLIPFQAITPASHSPNWYKHKQTYIWFQLSLSERKVKSATNCFRCASRPQESRVRPEMHHTLRGRNFKLHSITAKKSRDHCYYYLCFGHDGSENEIGMMVLMAGARRRRFLSRTAKSGQGLQIVYFFSQRALWVQLAQLRDYIESTCTYIYFCSSRWKKIK
jgi:hypothetical protein